VQNTCIVCPTIRPTCRCRAVAGYKQTELHEHDIREQLGSLWDAMDAAGVPIDGAVGFTPLSVAAGKDATLAALDSLSREWHERSASLESNYAKRM
jgi:hypothetical protein